MVFEVTGRCNHACAHCYSHWRAVAGRRGTSGYMTRARFRQLLASVQRDTALSQIAFSGGEPLLCEDLPGMVGDAVARGLSVVVISNGTLLDGALAARFPRGTIFELTLFSTRAATHDAMAGRRSFQRVLAAAVGLLRHGHHLVVACVVTKRNALDVGGTIDLAIALGADAVLLNRVNLARHTLALARDLVPGPGLLREALGGAEDRAARYGVSVSVSVPMPPCVVDPRPYAHLHFGYCPRGGSESYYTVGWNGHVRPCNHSRVELGDLGCTGFQQIVASRRAREYWRPTPGECSQCEHPWRDRCRGGCPAAADECTGRRDRMDPFVPLALGRARDDSRLASRNAGR